MSTVNLFKLSLEEIEKMHIAALKELPDNLARAAISRFWSQAMDAVPKMAHALRGRPRRRRAA